MALTISARLTMPTTLSPRITGKRLILWVVMSWATASTGVSSVTLITFLLMMAFTSLPLLPTISASETTPTILPFLHATGAQLIRFLINIIAAFFTVMVGLTVLISLVLIHMDVSFLSSI